MNRRSFIRTGTLAGVSLNALPLLCSGENSQSAAQALASGPDSVCQAEGATGRASGCVIAYEYPRSIPTAPNFKLIAGGHIVTVIKTSVGPFATFACDGPVEVTIEVHNPIHRIRIAPARHQIKAQIDQNRVYFTLPHPVNLLIEIDDLEQFFLFANPIEQSTPSNSASNVRYFKAGQVYEVGELRLFDNETLYIEGGAVVRGCIRATSASNIRICGQGILDGSYYRQGPDARRTIVSRTAAIAAWKALS